MMAAKNTQLDKPLLKIGSKGQTVKELQKLLFGYGMYIYFDSNGACVYPDYEVIDGVFGTETEAAVKYFQNQMFLREDGIVGSKTWHSLYKGVPVDTPVLGNHSADELALVATELMQLTESWVGK